MKYKFINISNADKYPIPQELTAEEEAEIVAQYMAERTPEAIEVDYHNIEKQIAESIPAEQLLEELRELAKGPDAE